MVRDGRRTLASLRAFLADFNGSEWPMRDIIRGASPWGCWSTWIDGWLYRCNTLWLRHEELVNDLPACVESIALHLQIEPTGREIPSFDELHAAAPTYWRSGATEGNGGMSPEDERLFWDLHGGTMALLGYER